MKLHLVRQGKVFQLSKSLVLRIASSKDFQSQWPASGSFGAEGPRLGYVMGLAVIVNEPWDAGDILEPVGQIKKERAAPQPSPPQPGANHIVILSNRNGDLTQTVWADEVYFPEEELL
jgi:hypothetical protein